MLGEINIVKRLIRFATQEYVLLSILILFVTAVYWKILDGFFQQDEWFGFGWFILNKKVNILETLKLFFTIDVGHYNPLALSIQYIIYYLWGIDYSKFAIFGIFLHLGTVIAVYFLAKVLFGKKLPAFFTALLFGLFASTHQAVSWTVVNISTLGAALFGVISAVLFFLFLKRQLNYYLNWSIFFLFISLLFKETTMGLFPLYFLLARGRRIFIMASGSAYLILRVVFVFISRADVWAQGTFQSGSLIVENFLTVPIKSIAQIFIPGSILKSVTFYIAGLLPPYMTGIPGSPEFEGFAVHAILPALSLLIGGGMLALALFKFKKFLPILGIGWVMVTSLIFSFAPETKESVSLIDSRNLYFASIGFAVFLVSIVNLISKANFRKFVLLLVPVIVVNLLWLNSNLSKFVEEGSTRRHILSTIKITYPDLPGRVIFYTQSDTSYYGLPEKEKVLPFQSGLGQTLLVYYHDKENFPKEFFKDRFLWEIDSQGYEEIGDRGFGYFRDYELMKKTLKSYKLDVNLVIAYSWDGNVEKLTDITDEVREKLKR